MTNRIVCTTTLGNDVLTVFGGLSERRKSMTTNLRIKTSDIIVKLLLIYWGRVGGTHITSIIDQGEN